MKKYFLLYLGLLLLVSPPSWSMDYDQDEDEYDQSDDENMQMQNGVIQQQQNMMYQNNMMMNQGMMPDEMQQNGMMIQQPVMMIQDGMVNDQMGYSEEGLDDEESKRQYVQSLVNDVLQIRNEQQSQTTGKTKNGGTVIDKNLKNKILKLQKDLDEISLGLKGISISDESESGKSTKKSKDLSEKDEFSNKSASKRKKKSSRKSEVTNSKERGERGNGKSKGKLSKFYISKRGYKIKTLSTSGKAKRFAKKSKNPNWAGNFHTVKQLTRENARRFVPEHRFSKNYSSGSVKVKKYKSSVPVKYKVKILGTGEIIPVDAYYKKDISRSSEKSNSQKNSTYFSDKSKCDNGCGAQ